MPIFMNSEHELIISGYCGGLVDVPALLLGILFLVRSTKLSQENSPNHMLLLRTVQSLRHRSAISEDAQ